MGSVVLQGHGELAPARQVNEPLGARFLQGGLGTYPGSGERLHTGILMLQQLLERLIALGKGKGLLAGGHADLLGRLHPQAFEHLGKLGVAHEHRAHLGFHLLITDDLLDRKLFVADGLQGPDQMRLLGCGYFIQMLFQQPPI